MKEIALLGVNGPIYAGVMTKILETGNSVNAMTSTPERIMLDTTNVTVSHYDAYSKEATTKQLTGYDTAVLVYETDYQNADNNALMLDTYSRTVNAAIDAGVKKLIVVGGKFSEAFLAGELRRHAEMIDAEFVSTEGCFAKKVAEKI